MSIAVSAVVKPSRILLVMVGAMCLCNIISAIFVGAGEIGNFAGWERVMLASTVVIITLFGWGRFVRSRKVMQVDVSGLGQIRLTELGAVVNVGSPNTYSNLGAPHEAWLMEDSTLWPSLLLLHFRKNDGKTTVLPILRDSLASDEFRRLSVACRWIAAHNTSAESR